MRRASVVVSFLALAIGGMLLPSIVVAQTPPPGPPPAPPPTAGREIDRRVKVFIDCSGFWNCDSEYFRTNLTYIDHVRDRTVADVHILITSQRTGSGGNEVTLTFIGLGPFARVDDLLRYLSPPNSATDAIRAGLVQKIKLGLMRYVAHSSAADSLTVATNASAKPSQAKTPVHDPWNYWVMRVSFNGNVYGEESSNSRSYSGGASANRTTEAWKASLSGNASYRQSSYDLGDGEMFTTVTRSSNVGGIVVKSLGPRWSAGGRASLQSSTYTNQDRAVSVAPAIEYDFFPYAESTRRIMTLQYSLGVTSFAYKEITIYDKTSETLPNHKLTYNIGRASRGGRRASSSMPHSFCPSQTSTGSGRTAGCHCDSARASRSMSTPGRRSSGTSCTCPRVRQQPRRFWCASASWRPRSNTPCTSGCPTPSDRSTTTSSIPALADGSERRPYMAGGIRKV